MQSQQSPAGHRVDRVKAHHPKFSAARHKRDNQHVPKLTRPIGWRRLSLDAIPHLVYAFRGGLLPYHGLDPTKNFTLKSRAILRNVVDQGQIAQLVAERLELMRRLDGLQSLLVNVSYPPGHFYSPVVDVSDPHAIEAVRTRTTAPLPAGIAIDVLKMTAMMTRLARQHQRFPFPRHQQAGFRFYFDNPFFGPYDASILFSVLLEFRPRRVIEVGCGHTSGLLLDTNDRFFEGAMELTLIDPSLATLQELWGGQGAGNARLIAARLQEAPPEAFESLAENDILFLDSSHVSKTGSDVNYYLFKILPMLKRGVLVHVHDILYPFEYLAEWILQEKRSWNEAYALHAFLQYNSAFEIVYWNNFAYHHLREQLGRLMPLCLENEGGSIWLRRIQ